MTPTDWTMLALTAVAIYVIAGKMQEPDVEPQPDPDFEVYLFAVPLGQCAECSPTVLRYREIDRQLDEDWE
jgi:hypothetical protein